MQDKKKEMVNKKQILLITILTAIAIIILFIIILINYYQTKEKEEQLINRQEYEQIISDVNERHLKNGEVIPDNDNIFTRLYDGTVSDTEIYEKIYTLESVVIPNINSKIAYMSEDEIVKYYKENENRIKQSIGSESAEEYVALVKEIKKSNVQNFEKAVYEVKEFTDGDPYAKVPLTLKYKEGELKLNLFVAKRKGTEILIMFKTL